MLTIGETGCRGVKELFVLSLQLLCNCKTILKLKVHLNKTNTVRSFTVLTGKRIPLSRATGFEVLNWHLAQVTCSKRLRITEIIL